MGHINADLISAAAIAGAGGIFASIAVERFCGTAFRHSRTVLTFATVAMVIWSCQCVAPRLLLPACCLGWMLLVLACTDLLAYRLPDALTLPLLALGLLVTARQPDPTLWDRLIGAAVGYAVLAGLGTLYHSLRGHDGLGLGDVKLAAASGAWLGWTALPVFILLACAGGFVWVAIRSIRTRGAVHQPMPFGVPLAAALWLMWLYSLAITPLP